MSESPARCDKACLRDEKITHLDCGCGAGREVKERSNKIWRGHHMVVVSICLIFFESINLRYQSTDPILDDKSPYFTSPCCSVSKLASAWSSCQHCRKNISTFDHKTETEGFVTKGCHSFRQTLRVFFISRSVKMHCQWKIIMTWKTCLCSST